MNPILAQIEAAMTALTAAIVSGASQVTYVIGDESYTNTAGQMASALASLTESYAKLVPILGGPIERTTQAYSG